MEDNLGFAAIHGFTVEMSTGTATDGTTVMIFALVASENVTGIDECLTFYYFDDSRSSHYFKRLLEKCDGLCYDDCTPKQRQRLDVLFEMVEDGRDAGWAVIQSGRRTTTRPDGFSSITNKIVTITATP
jgi:hypothetical protein